VAADTIRAVVTGHSRGIGEGIADELLARDIPVLGVSRRNNATLAKRFGGKLREAPMNLAQVDDVSYWLSTEPLREFFGGSDIALLVNNAGLLEPIGPLETQDPASIARTVGVNIAAPLMLSAAFAATVEAKDRRILHISSGAGRQAYAGWAIYCASKAALDHHVRCVALDKTPRLRVCSLAPGVVDTEMQTLIRSTEPEKFPDHPRFVELKRRGDMRTPRDIAPTLVDYLLATNFGDEVIAELFGNPGIQPERPIRSRA
jgi:benzil reductase ((S)-benzoin forming)